MFSNSSSTSSTLVFKHLICSSRRCPVCTHSYMASRFGRGGRDGRGAAVHWRIAVRTTGR
eukprot:4727021-Pyramimonas_sp.AAC.1